MIYCASKLKSFVTFSIGITGNRFRTDWVWKKRSKILSLVATSTRHKLWLTMQRSSFTSRRPCKHKTLLSLFSEDLMEEVSIYRNPRLYLKDTNIRFRLLCFFSSRKKQTHPVLIPPPVPFSACFMVPAEVPPYRSRGSRFIGSDPSPHQLHRALRLLSHCRQGIPGTLGFKCHLLQPVNYP